MAQRFEVHPTQISQWNQRLLERAEEVAREKPASYVRTFGNKPFENSAAEA